MLTGDGVEPVTLRGETCSGIFPWALVSGEENDSFSLIQGGLQILDTYQLAALIEFPRSIGTQDKEIGDRPREVLKDGMRAAAVLAEKFEVFSHVVADLFSEEEEKECDDSCQGPGNRSWKMPQAEGGEKV